MIFVIKLFLKCKIIICLKCKITSAWKSRGIESRTDRLNSTGKALTLRSGCEFINVHFITMPYNLYLCYIYLYINI